MRALFRRGRNKQDEVDPNTKSDSSSLLGNMDRSASLDVSEIYSEPELIGYQCAGNTPIIKWHPVPFPTAYHGRRTAPPPSSRSPAPLPEDENKDSHSSPTEDKQDDGHDPDISIGCVLSDVLHLDGIDGRSQHDLLYSPGKCKP